MGRGQRAAGRRVQSAMEKVQAARTFYNAGDYVNAAAEADKALSLAPANEHAHLLRGGAAAMCGDHGTAIKHFRAAQVLRPSKETLLALGESLRLVGDHAAALTTLTDFVRTYPDYIGGYLQMALVLEAAGNHEGAEIQYREAMQRFPEDSNVPIKLGQYLRREERIADAEATFRDALRQFSDAVPVWDNLAALLANCPGREEESIACYQEGFRREPNAKRAFNIGSLFNRLRRAEEALPYYQEALALDRNYPDAYNDLGFIYHSNGMFQDAEFCFRRAAELDGKRYDFLSNLGAALSAQGRGDEAEQYLLAAIALKPDSANPYHILASIYLERKQPEMAMALEREGLQVEPHFHLGLTQLAVLEADAGRVEVALDLYRQAYEVSHKDAIRILSAMLLPPIMGDDKEVLVSRQRVSDALDGLLAEQNIRVEIPDLSLLVDNGFYLAFHGLDDREILTKYSKTLRHVCPELNWVNPRIAQMPTKIERLRIGFVSRFLFSHSVSAAFAPVIKVLSQREDVDVFMVSLGAERVVDPIHLDLINSVDHYVSLSDGDLIRARDVIADLALDVLVFPDLGMHAFGNFLAHFRLARVQCVLNGHPDTCGIDTVDYRFSWDAPAEPVGAEAHYSERLIRLLYGGTIMPGPEQEVVIYPRESLGLGLRSYVVPMKLQKLHPDFDKAMAAILARDPEGEVVLFEDDINPSWKILIQQRFFKTIPDPAIRERIHFLPWQTDDHFTSMLIHADILLDPFHFGAGTTALRANSLGCPMVTFEGKFLRSRALAAMYQFFGVSEMVAGDFDDYVNKAVYLAQNPERKKEVGMAILQGLQRYKSVADEQAVPELVAALTTLARTIG